MRRIAVIGRTALLAMAVATIMASSEAHADRIEKSAAGGFVVRNDDGTQKARLVETPIGDYNIRANDGTTIGRIDGDYVDALTSGDGFPFREMDEDWDKLELVPP